MIGVLLHCAVMETIRNLCNDVQVLKSIWFGTITGSTHKERLESFYGPQAHVCEFFSHLLILLQGFCLCR